MWVSLTTLLLIMTHSYPLNLIEMIATLGLDGDGLNWIEGDCTVLRKTKQFQSFVEFFSEAIYTCVLGKMFLSRGNVSVWVVMLFFLSFLAMCL